MTLEARNDASKASDPFAHFGLDTLLSGAARLRPDTVALVDRDETLTYAAFASRATALGHLFAEHGLRQGERVILIGGASNALIIALIAAIRAGLEPALAPIDLSHEELSAYARAISAVALIGKTSYGEFSPGDDHYFMAAATADSVRLVATLGPGEIDGAVDLSCEAIKQHSSSAFYTGLERGKLSNTASVRIFTLSRGIEPKPVLHRQSTLIAAGFDFVARAKIGRETPILTTFPPTRFATLVAGPIATLLSGAALHIDGPFESEFFLKACDRAGRAHLIAPAAFGPEFVKSGITENLASLTLLSNIQIDAPADMLAPLSAACQVNDLYAFEETAAVTEERRGALAQLPARESHYIGFENAKILAVQNAADPEGKITLSGAAVSGADS
jgi:acyl-CoA synthetase (AMP-forming)/AMP-acid ligase II